MPPTDDYGAVVQHLVCTRCDDNPTVARLDDEAHLVCHCSHVGGEIDPMPIGEMELIPDRWTFLKAGATA